MLSSYVPSPLYCIIIVHTFDTDNARHSPGLVKGQWSKEEDELLIKLVEEGHKNWGALAARIPGRTSKQCRERWCHHLDPHIVKGEWTAEEDRTLITMHKDLGNKWATIAQVGYGFCPRNLRSCLGGLDQSVECSTLYIYVGGGLATSVVVEL